MAQKGFANIIGILILALFFGGLGFAFYKGYLVLNTPKPETSNTTPSASPTPQFTPAPSSDVSTAPNGAGETANWKTYTSKDQGFMFRYPTGWYEGYVPGCAGCLETILVAPKENSVSDGGFSVRVANETSIKTLEDYKKTFLSNKDPLKGAVYTNIKAVEIGGIKALFYQVGGVVSESEYAVIVNNKSYVFDVYLRSAVMQETIEKILSTFKFTN